MRISRAEELALIRSVLVEHGAPDDPATLQAEWLAEADLRGHSSHGLQRLPVIAQRISKDLTRPAATPRIEWRTPGLGLIDGGRALGPTAGTFAVDAVAERVAVTGVAVVATHDANHLGLLAPYVERLAERGLIGILLTTTEALVQPWDGRSAMVGTNPIAIGVPTAAEPFVLDMATSAISMGKLLTYRHRDQALEPGWAVDVDGAPTADPLAADALSPFGGAKGYGLALAFALVVSAMSGSALGGDVSGTLDVGTICSKGDLLICLDPGLIGADVGALQTYLDELRQAVAAPGTDGVSIPGDRARSRRRAALESGVEIPDAVLAEIGALPGGSW